MNVIFDVIKGRQGDLGVITLNRQSALNALNHSMVIEIYKQLVTWEDTLSIKAVIIRAAPGRAFSAGGDIRSVYEKKIENDPNLCHFFLDEYKLNQLIFHYKKPYIALLDGITMGGGAGISIHGSHRIATRNLVFSMPETAIGFYPDIGSSYFLSRLPDHIGLYLGLTAEKILYNDCYSLGLVDIVIDPEVQDILIETLANTSFLNKEAVTKIISNFGISVSQSNLLNYRNKIQFCFSKNSVEDIIFSLETEGDDWCLNIANILKKKSPTSLKVTFQEIKNASKMDFDNCMKMENRITQQMIEGHDFFEGIRAVIIDKDQKPHWNPARLEDVKKEDWLAYF